MFITEKKNHLLPIIPRPMAKQKGSIKNSNNAYDYTTITDKTIGQNSYQLLSSLITIRFTLVQDNHPS